MLVGALTGPIYDAGYFRALLSVGSFAVVFGFMMLSLATTYWQVILAQGICVGLGAGCLFVPSVAILSTYFSTKIATAMGLAAAGSSLGKHLHSFLAGQLLIDIQAVSSTLSSSTVSNLALAFHGPLASSVSSLWLLSSSQTQS